MGRTFTSVKDAKDLRDDRHTPPAHIALAGSGIVFRNIRLRPITKAVLFNSTN